MLPTKYIDSYSILKRGNEKANIISYLFGFAEIRIEDTGKGWAVRDGVRQVLCKDLTWEYEPLPSSRGDDFISRSRFSSSPEALFKLCEYMAKEMAELEWMVEHDPKSLPITISSLPKATYDDLLKVGNDFLEDLLIDLKVIGYRPEIKVIEDESVPPDTLRFIDPI